MKIEFVLRCEANFITTRSNGVKTMYVAPEEDTDDYTFRLAKARRFTDPEEAVATLIRLRGEGKALRGVVHFVSQLINEVPVNEVPA